MIDRPLNSDELGEKGEKRFGELCADARLVANPSNRDRAGWDYIVDFPLATDLKRLDSRPAPASARIQVKTQWSDRKDIKLRLSSAEQLVKYGGPSFICVLAVDADLQFSGMRIIHCRGDVAGRVLARLRKAEAEGERPNDIWLRIAPADYAEATPTHHSNLLSALQGACGSDQLAYATAKDAELRSLGYKPNFLQLKVDVRDGEDDIVDAFLGLRPLKVENASAIETRFDIALPWDELPQGPATMSFTPRAERSEVVFRTRDKTYRYRGRALRPPGPINAAVKRPKFVIQTDLIQVGFVAHATELPKTVSLSFGLNPALPTDARRKPSEWRDLYAILSAATDDGLEFEVSVHKGPKTKHRIHDEAAKSGPVWRKLARLTTAAALVFERAGAPNAKVSLQELWDAGDTLTTVAAMVRDAGLVTSAQFATDADMDLPCSAPLAMLLGHAFQVGAHVLAYGAEVLVTGTRGGGEVNWTSDKLTWLGLQRVRSERSFQAFLDGLPPQPYRILTGVYHGDRAPISRRLGASEG